MQSSDSFLLVMAGGKGTRFWPVSRSSMPKQYLKLISDNSLLEETLRRFDGVVREDNRYIVTVKDQEDVARASIVSDETKRNFIFEPSGRNTAPCIFLSLISLLRNGASANSVVAIVPSDHVILNVELFKSDIKRAMGIAASENKIVTIGVRPTFPHTGYGYIHRGDKFIDFYSVQSFKEKPDFNTAKTYLSTNEYFWNAGMFVTRIDTLLFELEKRASYIYKFKDELSNSISNFSSLSSIYDLIPSESIDYAVMEKSDKVVVLPASFDWNDLGSWDALQSVIGENRDKNTIISKFSKSFIEESEGNIVFAPDQFVSIVGLRDYIVVSSGSALMILPKDENQKVKNIYDTIKMDSDLKELV